MTFLQLLLYVGGVHRGGVVALFRSDKISEIHDLEEIFVLVHGLRGSSTRRAGSIVLSL